MAERGRFVEVLTHDEVYQIHLTALRVLEEVGLWLPHREILEQLVTDMSERFQRVSSELGLAKESQASS